MTDKPVILVVDDDQPILVLMKNILREFGFQTQVADSGAAAIAAVRSHVPDLILLDMKMPGMTGEEVINGLRSAGVAHTPILIVSGEAVGPAEVSRLRVSGAVQKPFDVPALIETIRGHVGVTRR